MAENVGTVYIKVRPELKGFRTAIEKESRKLRKIVIKVDADTDDLERKVREATKDSDATIKVDTDLDSGSLKPKAWAAAKAAKATIRFKSRLDPTGVLRDAFLTSKGIQNLLSQKPWKFTFDSLSTRQAFLDTGLFADLVNTQFPRIKRLFSDVGESMGRLAVLGKYTTYPDRMAFGFRRMSEGLKKIPGHLRDAGRAFATGMSLRAVGLLTRETYNLRGALYSLRNGFRHAGAGAKHFAGSLVEASRSAVLVGSIKSGLSSMLRTAASSATPMKAFANSVRGAVSHTAALAIAMGATVSASMAIQGTIVGLGNVIGYVVDGLKQMSGIGMLIPGILGGIGFVGATLFSGFRGLGGALGAAIDPAEDLSEHLEDLAPSAASFVESVREITPAWQDVAELAQQHMFAGMAEELKEVSERQLPGVTLGMRKLSNSFNHLFKKFAEFAGSERTVKAISQGFSSTSRLVANTGTALTPFLYALQDMGNVGLKALADMSSAWDGYAQRLANWTATDEAQKKMRKWIDDSIEGFKDFGKTVGNLYETFKQIGNAFGVDFDSSALLAFRETTDRFREWIGLADDADSRISKFADNVRKFTAPWIETFKTAWHELLPVFKELSPLIEDISDKFANNLQTVIEQISPKLEWFFKFLSDHKGLFGTIAASLLSLRVGLGVFKLGRMLLAPFASLLGGVLGMLLKIKRLPNTVRNAVGKTKQKKTDWGNSRAEKKARREEKKAQREERKAQKDAEKAEKKKSGGGGGWFSISREAKKAEKDTKKASGGIAKSNEKVNKSGRFSGMLSGLTFFGSGMEKTEKKAKRFRKNTGGKRLYEGLGTMTEAQKKAQKSSEKMSKSMSKSSSGMAKTAKASQSVGKGGKGGKFGKLSSAFGSLGKAAPKVGKGLGAVGKGVLGVGKFAAGGALRMIPFVGQIMMIFDIIRLAMWILPKFGPLLGKIFGKFGPKIGQAFAKVKDSVAGFFTSAMGKIGGFFSGIGSKIGSAFGNAKTWLVDKGRAIWDGLKQGLSNGWSKVTEIFTGLKDKILGKFADAGSWLKEKGGALWQGFKEGVSGRWATVASFFTGLPARIGQFFAGAGSWLLGKGQALLQGLGNGIRAGVGWIVSAVSNVKNAVLGFFSSAGSWLLAKGTALINGLANGVRSAIGFVTGAVTNVKNAVMGFFSGIGSWLRDSGRALIQGFVDGILAMVQKVRDAVGKVVDAAKRFFPHSPAKEGPFSGKGYTDHSGKALAKDFAKGMLSEKGTVSSAAESLVGSAAGAFTRRLKDPAGSLRDHHRRAVLDPVLEANAKQINDWAKQETEGDKKLEEKIRRIQASKMKSAEKEREISKLRLDAAKKNRKSYDEMVEGLEKPDYSTIPRSIRSYYIDGFTGMVQDGINDAVRDSQLASRYKAAALGAVKEGRRVFGNHPMFKVVEDSVTSEYFEKTLLAAIEDAGIAEVPVNFVVSNLDQLKSELGMGDGVVSRLLDQALDFDPADNDRNRFKESSTEVHYHVADMDEAIRLEKLRERKQLMRMK